jgi:DNA-binding NarL/FixJ family response regulator
MRVVTDISDDQFKHLYTVSKRTGTTVGALVAELVKRQLEPPEPGVIVRRPVNMTISEDATLVRMAREGRNNHDISKALQRSVNTIMRRRKFLGIDPAPRGRPKFRDV